MEFFISGNDRIYLSGMDILTFYNEENAVEKIDL